MKIRFINLIVVVIILLSGCAGLGDDYNSYNNERFVFSSSNELSLFDNRFGLSHTLILRVKKYRYHEEKLYITGKYSDSDNDSFYYDFGNGEFESKIGRIAPEYNILNLSTETLETYMTLEDVPEDQRQYFTMPVTEGCLKKRDCYDESLISP
jgi:hypothetical protein